MCILIKNVLGEICSLGVFQKPFRNVCVLSWWNNIFFLCHCRIPLQAPVLVSHWQIAGEEHGSECGINCPVEERKLKIKVWVYVCVLCGGRGGGGGGSKNWKFGFLWKDVGLLKSCQESLVDTFWKKRYSKGKYFVFLINRRCLNFEYFLSTSYPESNLWRHQLKPANQLVGKTP